MRREARDDVVEDAGREEIDLAAAILFRRCPDELEADLQTARIRSGGEERADVRRSDEVVTAAVPDPGERVVLGEQRDGGPGRTDARAEGSLEPAEAGFNRVAVTFEQGDDAGGGATLLIRQLGIGVDLPRQAHEIVLDRLGERAHHAVYCL